MVAITGDRGLAGALNVDIVRTAFVVAEELRAEGFSDVEFTTVGKKGAGTIAFRGMTIDRSFQGFSVEPTYADAQQVTEHLVRRFVEGGGPASSSSSTPSSCRTPSRPSPPSSCCRWSGA